MDRSAYRVDDIFDDFVDNVARFSIVVVVVVVLRLPKMTHRPSTKIRRRYLPIYASHSATSG